MARYTPHRPSKPTDAKKSAVAKKPKPKSTKPGAFTCEVCQKAFRTEEALAIHARDAHGKPIDPATMTPVAPNMVRCPECGMAMRKRNLSHHLHFVHEM